jgi:hypothetical protein
VPRPKSEVEANSSEEVFDEGMRVEWSKAQARKNRWEEEVQLIMEEMRRTIVYYEWRESWWLEKEVKWSIADESVQHGIAAYAQKQGYFCKCLAESFASAWLPFLESEGIVPEWKGRYENLMTEAKYRSTAIQIQHLQDDISGKEADDSEIQEEGYEEEYKEASIYDVFELDD